MDTKIPQEFVFLTEPGGTVQVCFNSEGLEMPQPLKDAVIKQYQEGATKELEAIVHNIEEFIREQRRNRPRPRRQ